jgi:hypothetical protein
VGDLKLAALTSNGAKFHMAPGTTVNGTFTITTFFTNSAEQKPAAAPAGAPAKK